MSELKPYPNESLAREVASSIIQRSANGRIPEALLPIVHELMVDAAHDFGEIKEALAELDQLDQPSDFRDGYSAGYVDGTKDTTKIFNSSSR